MAQITATTGLVSGIDYASLIDSLVEVNSATKSKLTTQNESLKKKQTAFATLMAYLSSVKGATDALGRPSLYKTTTAASSNSAVLFTSSTGNPATGTYQYTPLRKAQSQTLVSGNYSASNASIGAGTLAFRFGKAVDNAMRLDDINGGTGFTNGKIKITDRSGTSAVIDLTGSKTIDDVLDAINNNDDIQVTASVVGDAIQLADNTGEIDSNLRVQEVNSGKTAQSLGLAGINAASDSALGSDIVALSAKLSLDALNDGFGLSTNNAAPDFTYKLGNGSTGTISLSGATTIQEVIDQINAASPYLNAKLDAEGKLTVADTSKGNGPFWIDSNVNSQALEDLGLTEEAVGGVITATYAVHTDDILLYTLNDGAGVRVNDSLADIAYTLSNGETGKIILAGVKNLGDVIDRINGVNAHLSASISSDGRRLVLTDASGGTGQLSLDALNDSHALNDLGLNKTTVGGVLTGTRILSGAKTVLLSTLNGGNGLGALGSVLLTDRAGNTATVDLAAAETLEDVIQTLNGSGLQITAQINNAGNGLELVDTSGQTISNLKVENTDDGTTTAAKLFGAPLDLAANNAVGGDLHLQTINSQTSLAELNGGVGVAKGKFIITNSLYKEDDPNNKVHKAEITIDETVNTVGDVIKAINLSNVGVQAEINANGDGIILHDANGGTGILTVADAEGSTAARDLNLLGTAVSNETEQTLNGAMTRSISLTSGDTLSGLCNKINNLHAGLSASIVSDGINEFHLSISSQKTGAQSRFLVDASSLSMDFNVSSKAQDALLVVGSAGSLNPVIFSSDVNEFANVLQGATLTIVGASTAPVTVTVTSNPSPLAAQIKTFVDNYNTFRAALKSSTSYDATTQTGSVLTGEFSTYRADADLSELLSRSYASNDTIRSLAQLGIKFNKEDGSLSLDTATLNSVLSTNLEDVEEFFTASVTGVSARFASVVNGLAGDGSSLMELRNKSLQKNIEKNEERIDSWTKRLEAERIRLTIRFANLETSLAKLQNFYNALDTIKWITDSNGSNSLFGSNS